MSFPAVLPRLIDRATRGRPRDWEVYHRKLASLLVPGMTVVDVGCGDGGTAPFPWGARADVRRIGLDPDPAAALNPYMDTFVQLDLADPRWPLPDREADVVAARYVLEHVENPELFLDEAWRVLKPGGAVIFLTPNRRHPAMQASRMLPLAVKRAILRLTRGVDGDDVFRTYYRMNTGGRLQRQLLWAGFRDVRLQVREFTPSEYLAFTPPAYAAACAYDAAVRLLGLEGWLGAHIIGSARRPRNTPNRVSPFPSAVQ